MIHHQEKPVKMGDSEDIIPFICGICYEHFQSLVLYFDHFKLHDYDIGRHIQRSHFIKDKELLASSDLRDEKHSSHNECYFECSVCGSMFPGMCLLEDHFMVEADRCVTGNNADSTCENMDDYSTGPPSLGQTQIIKNQSYLNIPNYSARDKSDLNNIVEKSNLQRNNTGPKSQEYIVSMSTNELSDRELHGNCELKEIKPVIEQIKRDRANNICDKKEHQGDDIKHNDAAPGITTLTQDLHGSETDAGNGRVIQTGFRSTLELNENQDIETKHTLTNNNLHYDLNKIQLVSGDRGQATCNDIPTHDIDENQPVVGNKVEMSDSSQIDLNELPSSNIAPISVCPQQETIGTQSIKYHGKDGKVALLVLEKDNIVEGEANIITDKKDEQVEENRNDMPMDEKIPCDVCGLLFLKKNLRRHMYCHTNLKPYQCDTCNKTFKSKDQLYGHTLHHKKEKDLICDHCGKAFNNGPNLRQHVKIHTRERTLQCPLCPKMFRSNYILKDHITRHSDNKPYICDKCGRSFKTENEVQRHLRVHSEDRPYPCKLCEKAFKSRSNLIKHGKTHK